LHWFSTERHADTDLMRALTGSVRNLLTSLLTSLNLANSSLRFNGKLLKPNREEVAERLNAAVC